MRQRTKVSLGLSGLVACLTGMIGMGKMDGDISEYRSSIPKPLWRQKVELYDKRSSLIDRFGTPSIDRFTEDPEKYNSLGQKYQTTNEELSDVEQNIEAIVGKDPGNSLFQAIGLPISMFSFLGGGLVFVYSALSYCTKEEQNGKK